MSGVSSVRKVVINLSRHRARLAQFQRRAEAAGLHDVRVFEAIDRGGATGCYLSHLAILQRCHEPVMVFEDDAIFAPGFTPDVEPPEPADLIWLGGQHLQPPEPVAPGWVRPTQINRTHCYLANDPQKIADLLTGSGWLHVDHALTRLDIPQLALAPCTVGQAPGVSSIDGRTHPASRFWND